MTNIWNTIKNTGKSTLNFLEINSSTILGTGEEILKIPGVKGLIRSIPIAGNFIADLAHQATDRAKDFLADKKIKDLQETASGLQNSQSLLQGNITELQAGLQEAHDRELQLSQAQQQLEAELANATAETQQELQLQKQALEAAQQANQLAQEQLATALSATQAQIEEVQKRQADSEQAINILQDTSLSQEAKLNRLNQLAEQERKRLDNFEQKMSSFTNRLNQQEKQLNQHSQQIDNLHEKHCQLEQQVQENKLAIAKNEQELNQLKQEIQAKEFQQKSTEEKLSKLLLYTQKKEEIKKLEKQLKPLANTPDLKEVEQILKQATKQPTSQQKLSGGMPLNPNSLWAKQYSPEQIQEWGWELSEQGSQWKEVDQQISQALAEKFSLPVQVPSLVDAENKQKLTKLLSQNAELLAEICEELDLEMPELAEIPTPPKSPLPTEKPQPQPQPKNEEPKPEKFAQLITKLQQLPGATLACQIPWWVYCLMPWLLWLIKKYLFKLLIAFFFKSAPKKEPTATENEPVKCSCTLTKTGQRKKNTPLCETCQDQVTQANPKKLITKKRSFGQYLLLIISLLITSLSGYWGLRAKFFVTPPPTPPLNPEPENPEQETIPLTLTELNQEFQRIIEKIRQEKVPLVQPLTDWEYSEELEEPEEILSPDIAELKARLIAQQAADQEKIARKKARFQARRIQQLKQAREKELARHQEIKEAWEKRLWGIDEPEFESEFFLDSESVA